MAPNQEIRHQQDIAGCQSDRYPSIRAAALANDGDHTFLSRRLKGQLHAAPLANHNNYCQKYMSNY